MLEVRKMIFSRHKECGVAPLVILVVIAALLYILFEKQFTSPPIELNSEEKREQQNQKKDRETVKTEIRTLQEKNIIVTMNSKRNQVWIDTQVWSGMDVKQKQKLITVLSKYFDYEGSLANVHLYDSQSGKKIGSFSLWSGMKFY
jgi:hypothetical protein